jgi:hypothetical protein
MQRSANPFEAVPTNTVWRGQCPDNAGPSSLGTEPERYDGLGSKAGSKNSLIVLGPAWENTMAELTGRELHLLKKALAIAVLLIEQRPGPFQSLSDQADMKALLDRLIETDSELEIYTRSALIAITGTSDWSRPRSGK